MLRVVGIVGYKGSGKTALARALATELITRGHELAVIKHTSHHIDLPSKDTAILGEVVNRVGLISPHESGVLWKKALSLEDMIPILGVDFILVEGYKQEKTFPKIVCLRGEPDDRELLDGLSICAVGPAEHIADASIPVLGRDEIAEIADLVESKGFKLPNLDCEGCGHETCYDLAREIVAGIRGVGDCVSLNPGVKVLIDGRPLSLNPFISEVVRGTIMGMLSALKGFKRGKIEIIM